MATKTERTGPGFADAYPRHPKLDELVEAFERGDYAYVRREGLVLKGSTHDPRVRDAAEDLIRRTGPSRAMLAFLFFTLLLLLALAWYWTAHHGYAEHPHG